MNHCDSFGPCAACFFFGLAPWLMGSWFPAQSPNHWTAREFPIACNFHLYHPGQWGFPDSSVGKESACNARDPGSIPGLGRSEGEEIGYPLQYSWASLVAQLIKNPPAMRETWIRSLDWEDPLEKGKATHSSILAWRINSMDCGVHGVAKSWTRLRSFHFHCHPGQRPLASPPQIQQDVDLGVSLEQTRASYRPLRTRVLGVM